jgi:hypothetical protein
VSNDPSAWNSGAGPNVPPPRPNPAQFGYPQAPAGSHPEQPWSPAPGFHPPPPGKRPPRKAWYLVGAVLVLLGLVGAAVAVAMIVDVIGKAPGDSDTFSSGDAVVVQMDAGATRVVFVDSGGAGAHDVNCDVANRPGNSVRMERFDGSLTLNDWEAIFTVTAQDAGEYRITCTGLPSDSFGVGDDVGVGGFIGGVFGAIAGAGLSFVGVVVLVVTAVLRHRRAPAAGH